VRFVGSATIGTDHLDTDWLDRQGIAWAAAPGCNADAAAQSTQAKLLLACRRLGRDYRAQRVGIIGRGNVGTRLLQLLDILGVSALACDPPLAEQGQTGLVDLDQVLAQDVVSLHVPLTREGRWPTWRLLNDETLKTMQPGALLLNAARGEVVDGPALLGALEAGRIHAALDTWPGEPAIDTGLLQASLVASPHVAGYSLEGRLRGTSMIYQAWCTLAGIEAADRGAAITPGQEELVCTTGHSLEDLLLRVAHIREDDQAMHGLARATNLAAGFDHLRNSYPYRRDYSGIIAHCHDVELAGQLLALGIQSHRPA
jgi:erythronate-4-phosphate dehydrogenase